MVVIPMEKSGEEAEAPSAFSNHNETLERRLWDAAEPRHADYSLASMQCDRHSCPEASHRTHILAVQVHPSTARPHHLSREGAEAGVYVRVGSTNRRADRELIAELRRFARGEAYDEQPLPELGSEALDFRAASESFAPRRRLRRSDLETLRLLTPYQGRKVPTVGGVLLYGADRERRFPDAWVQAGRFRGTDESRILDRAEIRLAPLVERGLLREIGAGPQDPKRRYFLAD